MAPSALDPCFRLLCCYPACKVGLRIAPPRFADLLHFLCIKCASQWQRQDLPLSKDVVEIGEGRWDPPSLGPKEFGRSPKTTPGPKLPQNPAKPHFPWIQNPETNTTEGKGKGEGEGEQQRQEQHLPPKTGSTTCQQKGEGQRQGKRPKQQRGWRQTIVTIFISWFFRTEKVHYCNRYFWHTGYDVRSRWQIASDPVHLSQP